MSAGMRRERRRRLLPLMLCLPVLLGGLALSGLAWAQVPELPLPLPGDDEPDAPSPDPSPSASPQPEPDDDPQPQPTFAPPEFGQPFGPSPDMPPADDAPPDDAAGPQPQPTTAPQATGEPAAGRATLVGVNPVAAALPGVFGVALAGLLAVAGLGTGMLAMAKRGLFAVRDHDGGIDMEATKRWRLYGGLGLLAAAAVVGVVGWSKISLETLVAAQLVYVASTGFAVLVLAVAGGSLVIAEQLRADERRMREVEDALVNLAGQIQPLVSEPPRVISRKGRANLDDTTEIG